MRKTTWRILVLASVAVAACNPASLLPRAPRPSQASPGSPARPETPDGRAPLPSHVARGAGKSPMRASGITICKRAGIPRGYVAVDYVQSADCTITGDSTKIYNAAVVVDLESRTTGTALLICADQSIPSGWNPSGAIDTVTARCPRERGNKSTKPTVIEILKASDRS